MFPMPHPSHPSCFDHSNIWRRVQVVELLVQFSPLSCHFICLSSEHSVEDPVLKHLQSVLFP
jgi:hypothetical protein